MLVAERVGAHVARRRPRRVAAPRQVEQGADRRRALAPPAERREVVLGPSRAADAAFMPVEVERPRPGQRRGRASAGPRRPREVGDPVGVAPPQRREAGVEAGGGLGHPAYPHVGGQDPVEPAQQRRRRRLRRAPDASPRPGPAGRGRGGPPGRGRARRRRCARRTPASPRPPGPAARWPAPRSGSPGRCAGPAGSPSRGSRHRRRPGRSGSARRATLSARHPPPRRPGVLVTPEPRRPGSCRRTGASTRAGSASTRARGRPSAQLGAVRRVGAGPRHRDRGGPRRRAPGPR